MPGRKSLEEKLGVSTQDAIVFLDILEEYFNRSWSWINGLCRLGSCFLGLGEMGFFPLAFALLHCIFIADTFVDTMYTYLDPE